MIRRALIGLPMGHMRPDGVRHSSKESRGNNAKEQDRIIALIVERERAKQAGK
jgi:hypothetical protein